MRADSGQREKQAERLRSARAAAGFDRPTDAVEKFRWKQSTYMAHENGQNGIPPDVAVKYAGAFKVDPGWLLTGVGKGPKKSAPATRNATDMEPQTEHEDFMKIGRFDASFSMGPGALVSEHPEPLGYWLLESQWLRALTHAGADSLAIVKCSGDSMTPTLLDGDWVVVDKTQIRASREGIYAIRVFEDAWIKRLSLNLSDKRVRIISDNTAIPVQDVHEHEIDIIGRVVALVARKVA